MRRYDFTVRPAWSQPRCRRCGFGPCGRASCQRCGSRDVYQDHVYRATITRDGAGVWQFDVLESAERAEQLAIAWLDTHKPGWRNEGAYMGERA